MNMRLASIGLALLGGLTSLLPSPGLAADVAYYGQCYSGSASAPITAAGHTPVALESAPNAANLAGIPLLFAENCGTLTDPGVAAAVANGMILVVHDNSHSNGSYLPGTPNWSNYHDDGADINFTGSAPFLTGPGGTLTNSSLDGGDWSNHGSINQAGLPSGSTVYATTGNASNITIVSYPYGSGRVIYSTIPLSCYFPGGNCFGDGNTADAGMLAYATNLIACSLDAECAPPPATTCASEGYTGTKLTWCQNICEKGYTGATLNMWIRRWVDRYRQLPYCAAEPQPALQ